MSTAPTKFFYSATYATLYYMENGYLTGAPESDNGLFDTDESFIVELDNEEVPRSFYDSVIATLTK